MRLSKPKQTGIFSRKISNREKASDQLTAYGCNCSTDQTVTEYADKQVIEHHVGQSGGNDHTETELRFLGCNEETLKDVLQHECRHRDKGDARVDDAVTVQFSGGTERSRNKRNYDRTKDRKNDATAECDVNEHREIFIGFLFLPFTECLGNDRAASGSDHETECGERHQKRQDQVDCCKCSLSGIVGDKQSVHDTVDRGKNHHDDGWQHKLY